MDSKALAQRFSCASAFVIVSESVTPADLA
jgi:hypothetical protein